MLTNSLSTTQRNSMLVENTWICLFQCISPHFLHNFRISQLVIKPITAHHNKIMRWWYFEMFDFRFWCYHMGVPPSFSNFCMSIPNSPWYTQPTWNNPMRTTDLSSLLNNLHSIRAWVMCLLVEWVCAWVGQNFINFLQNHVAIGSPNLLDCRYIYFSTGDSDTLHFFSIWRLVVSTKDENLFSTLCAEDCSGITDVGYIAIVVDYKANDQAASSSEEFLVSGVFLVGRENFIVSFENDFSKSGLRVFQK